MDAWLESPTLVLLAESDQHWTRLRSMLSVAKVTGPQINDARVATLCVQHGVRALWSQTATSADSLTSAS